MTALPLLEPLLEGFRKVQVAKPSGSTSVPLMGALHCLSFPQSFTFGGIQESLGLCPTSKLCLLSPSFPRLKASFL